MDAAQKRFVKDIYSYFAVQGRHDLPWRQTTDPYRIVVSEIMLQQTQVPRVIEKYTSFLQKFPTVQKLAAASLGDVLIQWSGLGYNRRAKFLHQMAQIVTGEYKGKFPTTIEGLLHLPGIGPYTARAVAAFAYNTASALIETNVRTVYIHHFFPDRETVSDAELMPIIAATVDQANPRAWYWALMDYGSHLKTMGNKVHRKSNQYAKQSKFEGSRRQIRGGIMKALISGPKTVSELVKLIGRERQDIESVLADLTGEGFIKKDSRKYLL